MKRVFFFSFSFLCLLVISARVHAQSAAVNNRMQLTTKDHKLINMVFDSQQLGDKMQFLVAPDQPVNLQVRVVDASGAELVRLAPMEVKLRQVGEVDLSALPKGQYFLEIAEAGSPESNRVAFQK